MTIHPYAFVFICLALGVTTGLTFFAKWRLERIAPAIVHRAVTPGYTGLAAAWIMGFGSTSTTLLFQCIFNLGAMCLLIALVFGIQLCFFSPESNPPDDDEISVDPIWPPADGQTQTHPPRFRRSWKNRQRYTRTCVRDSLLR